MICGAVLGLSRSGDVVIHDYLICSAAAVRDV